MTEITQINIARNPESRVRTAARCLRVYPDPLETFFQGSRMATPVNAEADVLTRAAVRFHQGDSFLADPAELPQAFRDFDSWLTTVADAPNLAQVDNEVIQLARTVTGNAGIGTAQAALDALVGDQTWRALRLRVADSLTAAGLVSSVAVVTRQFLIRTVLVIGLIEYLQHSYASIAAGPSPSEAVQSLLQRRTPLLPSPPFPLAPTSVANDVPADFRAVLARAPRFGDIFVVRSEWACYQAGEIAHVENVLKGERKKHTLTQTDETTVTTETENHSARHSNSGQRIN
jgi:hypothetical protein